MEPNPPPLFVPVRRDPRADSLYGAEIGRILRGRLILLCLMIQSAALAELVFLPFQVDRADWARTDRLIDFSVLGLYAIPLVILWRVRDLSPSVLRGLELAIFITAAVLLAVAQYLWYRTGWLFGIALPGQEPNFTEILGDSLSFPWFVLIVFYGACIPNTGRQCARMVAALAVLALGLLLALHQSGGPLAPYLFQNVLIKLLFWLGLASAMAIYGSQKLNELRREAFEARQLGHYLLKEPLGKGGMGEVYLAEHRLLKRPCAVKLIRQDRAGSPHELERFEREVQATAALAHPNVVEIYDYGRSDDGTFYYVMELLRGLNLAELVKQHGPLPPGRVVYLLRQVCGALEEAHAQGLVHRDIKPSNIVACKRGQHRDVAKLVDFGLVGAVRDDGSAAKLTRAGIIVGTPPYMSPEQVKNAHLDGRSDLYSLGVVAYYLLTGASPFRRATAAEMFAAHLHEAAPPLLLACPLVEADLDAVITRCLQKSPVDRFADPGQLQQALGACRCASTWSEQHARLWWSQQETSPSS